MGEEKKDERASTVRGRELGAALRRALSQSDNGPSKLAKKLQWSPSKVSNLLAARRGTSEADVAAFLALCGVVGEERELLLRLSREASEPGWWQAEDLPLSDPLRSLIDHETGALSIEEYQISLIPGLLQSPDYIRALVTLRVPKPPEAENAIKVRLARQGLLNQQHSPECTFFIEEYALRRTGPGREVMVDQLHRILALSVRPNVTIRVVLDAVGLHSGLTAPFRLMKFREIKTVAHEDNTVSTVFLEREDQIKRYQGILDNLYKIALSEGQSREFIARLAIELGRPPGGSLWSPVT